MHIKVMVLVAHYFIFLFSLFFFLFRDINIIKIIKIINIIICIIRFHAILVPVIATVIGPT